MKLSVFLTISAILSFIFGSMMFFIPSLASQSLGIGFTPQTGSLLQGMGGLIIGFGLINLLARNIKDPDTIKAILITNIVTNLLGLLADIFGVINGALLTTKIIPVEITHLFIIVGSLIYLLKARQTA